MSELREAPAEERKSREPSLRERQLRLSVDKSGSVEDNDDVDGSGKELVPYSFEEVLRRAGGDPDSFSKLPRARQADIKLLVEELHRVQCQERGREAVSRLALLLGFAEAESEGEDSEEEEAEDARRVEEFVFSQKPTIKTIDKCVLTHVVRKQKWRRVGGTELDIDDKVLADIEEDACDNDDAYYEVLKYWVKNGQNVTWSVLFNAVGRFETGDVMDKIKDCVREYLSSQMQWEANHLNSDEEPNPPPQQCHEKMAAKVLVAITQPFKVTSEPLPENQGSTRDPPADLPLEESEEVPVKDPTLTEDRLLRWVGHNMGSNLQSFSTHLEIDLNTFEATLAENHGKIVQTFSQLVGKWLRCEHGTGQLDRTWPTVCRALRDAQRADLARKIEGEVESFQKYWRETL